MHIPLVCLYLADDTLQTCMGVNDASCCVGVAGRGKWQRHQAAKAQLDPLPEYEPFQPVKAIACDLFPHTSHVESVVLLERGGV